MSLIFIYIWLLIYIYIPISTYILWPLSSKLMVLSSFKALISPYLHSLRSRTAMSSRAAWCVPSFAPHLAAFTWNLGISDANIFHWQGQQPQWDAKTRWKSCQKDDIEVCCINYVQVSHLSSHFGYISSWLLGEALQCLVVGSWKSSQGHDSGELATRQWASKRYSALDEPGGLTPQQDQQAPH